jgi:tRNA C32,U32 (ribose-2'-O)-methylase TrmJ
MLRNIRNLFLRTGMTDQEVRTFHGMLSALIGKNQ